MIYGIWPGVASADLTDFTPLDCPSEDVRATRDALESLQGPAPHFYVRCYRHFGLGNATYPINQVPSPADPSAYLGNGRMIDLVCCYATNSADPEGFAEFVRAGVRDVHGWGGGKVQVGEELNMPSPLDGGSAGCFEAVAAGVRAAAAERELLGADVLIGVNAAGFAEQQFWEQLAASLGAGVEDLDYLGIDIFPDVFRPVPHDSIPASMHFVLETTRRRATAAGFPASLPLHITENGWPTGRNRDVQTQAEVLGLVAKAVETSGENVQAYELFGLRDTLTNGNWHHEFGLLKDDYTPKPAFVRMASRIAGAR